MAELMPCPSCKATLRVPPGAEAIRCPQCKTVVPLKKPEAKAAPPEVKRAIPLPFDRPAVAKPVPAEIPKAKPVAVEKAVVRGKVVREEEEDDEERTPKKRRRDEDSIKNNPRYEDVEQACSMARIGVWLLTAGCGLSFGGALLFSAFLASIAIASSFIPELLFLSIGCLGLHCLAFLIGYGFCIAGPKGMRSTAGIGLFVTLFHAAIIIPLAIFGFVVLAKIRGDDPNLADVAISRIVFVVSSFMNNLNSLTDFPWMFLRGDFQPGDWKYIGLMLLGSFLEFAKMSVLGTLIQYYASEGKSHELGFRSLKFVYRIIWVVIIVGILKLLALIGFRMIGGDNFANGFFRIPQTLFTVAYFLWWAFAWYEQFTSMKEAVEVITPARFLDKRSNLDHS